MNEHVQRYYAPNDPLDEENGHFSAVIRLEENCDMMWEEANNEAPDLPRGWWELARFSTDVRIEFLRSHWLTNLPFVPHVHEAIATFFGRLDDVGVYLVKRNGDAPFEAQLVYSQRNNSGFFHGNAPANQEQVAELKSTFPFLGLPEDYLLFMQIHNGFSKVTDTGILHSHAIPRMSEELKAMLEQRDPIPLPGSSDKVVNPSCLIPFYQSFGMDSFQCFYSEWYPESEMGNIYYSGFEHSISDFSVESDWAERLAFPTFLEWLVFYLESVAN